MKLLPGVRLNVGRNSTSLSFGGRGARVTFGKHGTSATVGVPGTGISHTRRQGSAQGIAEGGKPGAVRTVLGYILFALCLVVIATMVLTQK